MTKKYSINDLVCARVIWAEREERVITGTRQIGEVYVYTYGEYVHHRRHVAWADKVIKWWRSFWTAVAIFRKQMLAEGQPDAQAFAIKGVWQCVHGGISPGQIVRDWRGHRKGKTVKRWTKSPESPREPVHGTMRMKSRSSKWEVRERRRKTTDRLQTETLHGYSII